MINTEINSIFNPKKILLLGALIFIALLLQPYYTATAWFGFFVAAYSTMANDSIQTLGTFLSSHKKTSWWLLWAVFGVLMIIILTYGWYTHGHRLGFGRLDHIPRPDKFSFLAILAPIILLALTQLRVPISTTFLILSMFSNEVVIHHMLLKSFFGYVAAFITAFMFWWIGSNLLKKITKPNYNKNFWQITQWIATSFLWVFWLTNDMANMVSFLPRKIDITQLLLVLLVVVLIFGIIMYQRGSEIQEIVNEKKGSQDTRAATVIDGFCNFF